MHCGQGQQILRWLGYTACARLAQRRGAHITRRCPAHCTPRRGMYKVAPGRAAVAPTASYSLMMPDRMQAYAHEHHPKAQHSTCSAGVYNAPTAMPASACTPPPCISQGKLPTAAGDVHGCFVPQAVLNKEGQVLDADVVINQLLADGEDVFVEYGDGPAAFRSR